MTTVVIVVVKISGHAGLRVGEVRKNGPVPQFEHLRFETHPETLGLGIIVAVADAAVQELGLGIA